MCFQLLDLPSSAPPSSLFVASRPSVFLRLLHLCGGKAMALLISSSFACRRHQVYVFCLCNLNQHDFNFKYVILQSASIWMSCLNRIKRFNKAQMKFHRKTGFLVALSFCPLVCKAVNVKHHRVGQTDEPASYRINDELGLYLASFKVTGVARIGIRVDVVKFIQDLHFFVTGGYDENELDLATVLQGFFEAVTLLLRGNIDQREALENLDMMFLCLDEIVDGGSVSFDALGFSLVFLVLCFSLDGFAPAYTSLFL
ncbi:hypothetical protein L2E82_16581 [Cichorium intybus]|uniref:Uncharacterized protein n=1 Tax=Cichorium intybus TaxID=13427 RepID=A0ACB9F6W9_CICIN|nr:hypothetical protein L2E82_16581 [Cichorium intybus]